MAAVAKKHVQTLDDGEPESEDIDDQSGSEGGSVGEGSGDEGSGGEEAGDEDGGEEEEDVDDDDVEDGESNANAGWAEAMAKILGKKTEENKSSILIKNKEMDKVKERERQEQLERKNLVDKRRTWEMMSRVKPDIGKDRETEKSLQRIATRGVVQLFNAVKKHQKTVDDKLKEVGGSERKKAKILSSVSKRDFIDVLRRTEGGGSSKTENNTAAAAVGDEKPAWSVLRDDFMMGATMKDWDKDSDGETEPHAGEGAEEEGSDSD